jgi:hypothetical protein
MLRSRHVLYKIVHKVVTVMARRVRFAGAHSDSVKAAAAGASSEPQAALPLELPASDLPMVGARDDAAAHE